MVPYPAYRWLWRETMAFRWKQDGHINEPQALVSHIRRLLKEPAVSSVRLMVVIDSQVLFYCFGKGRSASKRLNCLLKRFMALELAGDFYFFPIWTLSAWNYADNPSRRLRCRPSVSWGSSPALSRVIDRHWNDFLIGWRLKRLRFLGSHPCWMRH